MRSGRNRHVWVGVLEVLPRYYSARQQLCASLFSVSIAICAQAFRRRSAVEEKRGPGAEGTGCSGLQRMPASAEEVMSGSEEEDADVVHAR